MPDLPSALPSDVLDRLGSTRTLLELIDLAAPAENLDDPPRKHWHDTIRPTDLADLSFDPASGRFAARKDDGSGASIADGNEPASWLSFPDPTIAYDLTVATTADHATATGPFDLALTFPSAVLTLPQLRGAKLDAQGLPVEDPANPKVRFALPQLVVRITRSAATGDPAVTLESPPPGDPNIYRFCRMEPPHALIGPGTVLGFTCRAAILDLSEQSNPPAAAKSLPSGWQGIFLPEIRLYVSPHGLEDLAVAAGAEDLWIGIGNHYGVTGTFELDVVNRGATPVPRVRFHDPSGRWIGTSGAAPNLTAELPEQCTAVVDATGGIAPYTISIDAGGTVTTGDRASVSTPAAGTVTITVTVTDAGGHPANLTVTASRRTTPLGPVPGENSTKPAELTSPGNAITKAGEDETTVELRLADPASGTITWDPPAVATGTGTAKVTVAGGQTVDVTAHRHLAATDAVTLTAYFHYDHPAAGEDGTPADPNFAYSLSPDNTHSAPAVGTASAAWSGGTDLRNSPAWAALGALPRSPGSELHLDVEGFASYDGKDDAATTSWNEDLAARRAAGLGRILTELGNVDVTLSSHGFDASRATDPAHPHNPKFWKATATATAGAARDETYTAHISRPAPDAPPPPAAPTDPEPARPGFPDWFHRLGVKVRLERGDVVLVQLDGEIDIRTATEQRLAANDPQATLPPANPGDGISDFVLRLDLDRSASAWKVTASFRAVDADLDGLWKVERDAGHVRGVNVLGALAALGPVLAAVAPPSPAEGNVVPLALTTGAATGLAIADVLKTKSMILHGGELVIDHGPQGTDYVVLLDLETAIGFDAGVISVDLSKPITTRYKAIGIKLGDRDGGAFEARPVFDASKGYTLDIPAGAVTAAGPLADLLNIFGAKVSRDNPTYLEVDVGIGADLGIVTVDRARVRLRLDQPPNELPTLSALGATIEVPGAFRGSGYLEITDTGVIGSFDVTIQPIGVRAMAGINLAHTPDGTFGVFFGARLELPAPIPLGNSGLGIYGFAAGLGVNMTRTPAPTPLAWLLARQNRDPLDPTGWTIDPGAWAFAVGATLGTVDGGFICKMQGLILLELPGPRVLILMKARIMTPPFSADDYPLLAAIDISPDAITIGLLAEYGFASLVELRVPVRMFFDFHDVADWQFDLGTFSDPIVVRVLDLFHGTGYLMIHGKGINPGPPGLPAVTTAGITLAVGFHVQFVWGDTGIGLYAKVAGGVDALVSIDPVFVAGKLVVSGELRLFIVSIGASAELDVQSDGHDYHVHGSVHGEVDFFFFSVEGTVDFTLNSPLNVPHVPPPLVDGVALVSRSPALVDGSGTDTVIDGVLGRAHRDGVDPPGEQPAPLPLDAVPVVEFAVTPVVDPALKVLGATPLSDSGAPPNAWVRRGANWWRYELRGVELTPVPGPGTTPSAWWVRAHPTDPLEGSRLALLSWLPEATPRAVPYGEQLDRHVREAWGGTCDPVAPPAPSLYTFDRQPAGPRPPGWTLAGIPWPDDPGTYRGGRERETIRVTERWRCGDAEADRWRGVHPAEVIGGHVACAGDGAGPPSVQELAARSSGRAGSSALSAAGALEQATAALAEGVSPRALLATLASEPLFERLGCRAALLQSPSGDSDEPARFAGEDAAGLVKRAWEAHGFTPGDLRDGIVVHTGETPYVEVLLAGSEAVIAHLLRVRYLAANGTVVGERSIAEVGSVGLGALPPRWWDPAGPWRDTVERTTELLAAIAQREHLVIGLARLEPPPGTDRIELGLDPAAQAKPGNEPFYLAALELVSAAETRRHGYDVRTQSTRVSTLTTVLSTEPDDYALFAPGTSYTVAVRWQAFWADGEDRPGDGDTGTPVPEQTQTFTFTTQSSAEVPRRLDPWVLDTTPGDREPAAFCDDPVRISFATQNVADLFDAYGYRVAAVLHGASGRHPNPSGPPTTGQPPRSITLHPTIAHTGAARGVRITTPWEEAVRALDLPCVPAGERDEHVSVVLPFPLDARTDYLIDLVLEPKAGDAPLLAYRHGFTTSRYRSLDEFGATIRAATAVHLPVVNPAALGALAAQPTGDALDAAFVAAGLDRFGVPRVPRLVVLWSTAVPPQPAAVIVDADEPLWRRRRAPVRVPVPPAAPDPRDLAGYHWARRDVEWLTPRTAGTTLVERIVEAPGGQRAVILLGPGQRGTTLTVRLDRATDPVTGDGAASAVIGGFLLGAAPWEDDEDNEGA